MALDVRDTLMAGLEQTVSSTGIVFAGLFFLVGTLNALFATSFYAHLGRHFLPVAYQPTGIVLPIPAAIGIVLVLMTIGAALVFTVAALRVFVRDDGRIRRRDFSQAIGVAALNLVVGGLLAAVLVAGGAVLLVFPGILLLVGLVFSSVFVAVDGRNAIGAMHQSWEASRGIRFELFGILFAVCATGIVLQAVFGLLAHTIPPGMAGNLLLRELPGAVTVVFSLATVSTAYRTTMAPKRQ